MSTYYCEIIIEHGKFPKGIYTFDMDSRFGGWGRYTMMAQLSQWVIKENDGRVVWIKNRSRVTPDFLTQDELKQFMWTKLKAKDFKI